MVLLIQKFWQHTTFLCLFLQGHFLLGGNYHQRERSKSRAKGIQRNRTSGKILAGEIKGYSSLEEFWGHFLEVGTYLLLSRTFPQSFLLTDVPDTRTLQMESPSPDGKGIWLETAIFFLLRGLDRSRGKWSGHLLGMKRLTLFLLHCFGKEIPDVFSSLFS